MVRPALPPPTTTILWARAAELTGDTVAKVRLVEMVRAARGQRFVSRATSMV